MSKALILITFNREDAFKKSLQSVDPLKFDKIVIVRDGGEKPYSEDVEKVLHEKFVYLPQKENIGVGKCKQLGINLILEQTEIDDIFIIEDDIVVKDNGVWDHYVDFSKKSGIWHTNWNDYRYKGIKFELDFDGIRGIVTKDTEASFSYFHRNMFKFCEFPPDMKNAFEHVSVELQLIEKHLLPPFWNFVCPKDTDKFLSHLEVDSTITNRNNYTENYQNALKAFEKRHGITTNNIPDVDSDKVLERIKFLKENYAKNK